jgi:hypothetical protein
MESQSTFRIVGRKLIKSKIHFTTSDAEPRVEIQGERFTTQELIQLHQENKLTNPDLSEIIRAKWMTTTSKGVGPRISSTKD